MSRIRVVGAAAGVLAGAGGLVAALGQSTVAVLVLGALALVALVIVGVVVLAPVFSRDDRRADRALTVLGMLLSAGPTPAGDTQRPSLPGTAADPAIARS